LRQKKYSFQPGDEEEFAVLRPGGQFLLADVAVPRFLVKFIHHGKIRNQPEVRNLFEEAGLEAQTQQRVMPGHFIVTVGIRR
jgi:hypothetical protein